MNDKRKKPNLVARLILKVILPDADSYYLQGDYEEEFNEIYEQNGAFSAHIWFWFLVLESIPGFISRSVYRSLVMIKNYLKITLRAIVKNKGFSFINIVGLSLSMSVCLMIIIFVKNETSSDQFHEKKDRIFRVYTTDNEIRYSATKGWAATPGPLASTLQNDYSGIEDVAQIRRIYSANVIIDKTAFPVEGLMTDRSFFNVFSYRLSTGDPETALQDPNTMIISRELADKFFSGEDPIGKVLTLEAYGDYRITGILEEMNYKSHFEFDFLMSLSTAAGLESKEILSLEMNNWTRIYTYYTYILLENREYSSVIAADLPELEKRVYTEEEDEQYGFELQHLLDINLGINLGGYMPGTKHSFEIVFIPFVALLIILLACFNYIILSIARALRRTREIGLRKVVGSRKNQIVILFLSEAFIITFVSLIGACLIMFILVPVFNQIEVVVYANSQINLDLMNNLDIYLIFLLFAFGVSLIAGLYPALYLSSFKPVNALQGVGRIKGSSSFRTRKIMMVTQFMVSIISIILIIFISKQFSYMMTYDKGITIENKVNVRLGEVNYETFKNTVMTNSNVLGISVTSSIPVHGAWGQTYLKVRDMAEPLLIAYFSADPLFLDNFGLELVAGRNFSDEYSTDKTHGVILNEKALEVFGLGTPVEALDKHVYSSNNKQYNIIGVLKNFNYRTLENPIEPMMVRYYPDWWEYATISYAPGTKSEIRSYLGEVWGELDPVHPIDCRFYDDMEQQQSDFIQGTLIIASWGTGLIIIIALLGLLGMTTYSMELRLKEVGIRKVMGASVERIVYMLSKDSLKLIFIAGIIGCPLSWFLSSIILQTFAFRTDLSLWVFPAAFLFISLLALLTIGTQTFKAASTNPVNTLRDE
ncbi:MAG: FtsX-like permease family protein [bacterium]|nr:FtsX-like permease family protein [bacterium]